jgi:hypothetical protein
VTFESTTGDLELGDPAGFSGTIAGFSANDVIDLLNTAVTGFTYANSTLTLSNGSTVVAALTLSGAYSQSSFMTVSDGHGGTDIVDPRSVSKSAAASSQLAQLIQAVTSLSASPAGAGSAPLLASRIDEGAHMLASSPHWQA